MEIVNLGEKVSRIHDYWNPRITGELNDSYVKLGSRVSSSGTTTERRTSSSSWSRDASACSSVMVTGILDRAS